MEHDYGYYLGRHKHDIFSVCKSATDNTIIKIRGVIIGEYGIWLCPQTFKWVITFLKKPNRALYGVTSKSALCVIARKLTAIYRASLDPDNNELSHEWWCKCAEDIVKRYSTSLGYTQDREKGIVYTMYGYHRKRTVRLCTSCHQDIEMEKEQQS